MMMPAARDSATHLHLHLICICICICIWKRVIHGTHFETFWDNLGTARDISGHLYSSMLAQRWHIGALGV